MRVGRRSKGPIGTASPLARQRSAERGMTVLEDVGKRVEIID